MGKSEHCDPETREAVQNLHKDGNFYRKIAKLFGVSKTMVEHGVKWISVKETRGRKAKVTPGVKRKIVRCVKKIRFISSKQIKSDLNINIDTSTIRRTLIKENLKAHSARKVLMLSKKNIQQRLQFANSLTCWSREQWRNIH